MNITRSMTIKYISIILYDPNSNVKSKKEIALIGNLTDEEIEKKIKKLDLGIVIDWELDSEETKIYGMSAETFYNNREFEKEVKGK